MNQYHVIGLMSGTSLDGVDLAACVFTLENGRWNYRIIDAQTVPYPGSWKTSLASVHRDSAYSLALLDKDYGHYLGELVRRFIETSGFHPDLIASHGHTIFHQPGRGFTFQLGSGAALAARTGIPVACDFRTSDLGYGGQGAPLVPAGDKLLFGEYACCLNLGGFSNISFESETGRIAHDISPCNLALNFLAGKLGRDYDEDGHIAREGKQLDELFEQLNSLSFYQAPPPKSLGREWFETAFLPLIDRDEWPVADILRTVAEHIAYQVASSVPESSGGKILITGGGACHRFLTERISDQVPLEVVVPDRLLVDFKEALVFAFLGVLRLTGQVNVFSSVTGASRDHCAGAIYL